MRYFYLITLQIWMGWTNNHYFHHSHYCDRFCFHWC